MIKQFLVEHYSTIKAFHLIAVISWMAGMLYLPRLFVYHSMVKHSSPECKMLQIMERKLLRYIINPAMIITFLLGILMIWLVGFNGFGKWLHAKLFFTLALAAVHGLLARHRKTFVAGKNKRSHKYYRVLNEAPTVLMIIIVCLAVVKPF